jgi:hypothetical protein
MTTEKKTRTIESDDHGYPRVDEIEIRSLKFPVYFAEGKLRAYVTSEDNTYPLAVQAATIEELRSLPAHTPHRRAERQDQRPVLALRE